MSEKNWYAACRYSDLVSGSGICALVNGQQVAIFFLPKESPVLYAIDNFDPIGNANVLSRGIVGDIGGELVVASPLYKEHFSLTSGRCLEKTDLGKNSRVRIWPIRLNGDVVEVSQPAALSMESAA